MTTVVYQTFRTADVPRWVGRCLASVRGWAAGRGFEYRFFDDAIFRYVPDWYFRRAAGNMCYVTNLARLNVARELLGGGAGRAIWVDADVFVFDPERFVVEVPGGYVFAHEAWVDAAEAGPPAVAHRVNNSVCGFDAGNPVLDFLAHAAERVADFRPDAGNLDIGTKFLTGLRRILPIPLVGSVGMFSPAVAADVLAGGGPCLEAMMRAVAVPLAAGNLCGSLRNKMYGRFAVTDDTIDRLIDALEGSRGGAVNRHFRPPPEHLVGAVLLGK